MNFKEKSIQEIGIIFKDTKSNESFTELYNRLKPGLEHYVGKIFRNKSDIDSILSSTFSTVFEKIDQYKKEWHISTWVYRIAYTTACMELRVRKKESLIKFTEIECECDKNSISKIEHKYLNDYKDVLVFKEDFDENERAISKLQNEIQTLSDKFKTIIVDRYYNNLKYEELSEKYDLPIQTIKNRLFRAKYILREKLSTVNVVQ